MTVLVGCLCQDGVIVGADSGTTSAAAANQFTVIQPTLKLDVIRGNIIVATTGAVGLSQRFKQLITDLSDAGDFSEAKSRTIHDVAKTVCVAALQDFTSTGNELGKIGLGALMAFPHGEAFHLCEFETGTLQPEFKNEKVWYVSMGSGQPNADPLLGLMRICFSPDQPPSLREGLFIVSWTLHHTIEIAPGFVRPPFHLAVIESAGGAKTARIIDENELAEHKDNVIAAQEHFRAYRDLLSGPADLTVPPLPDVDDQA